LPNIKVLKDKDLEFANSIRPFNLDNPRGIGQRETTDKDVHVDRTHLRQEMEHGA
jgi:hypothetical protein